jgi:hypothetical protein
MRWTASSALSPPLGSALKTDTIELPPNVRAVIRVATESFQRSIAGLAASDGNDLIRVLVFNAIWLGNVQNAAGTAEAEQAGLLDALPDERRIPVSVLGIANSLRMPYETVRRYSHTLLNAGSCVRLPSRGLIVPQAVHNRPARVELVESSHGQIVHLLDGLKRAGFDFEPYRRPVAKPEDATANIRAIFRHWVEAVMRGLDNNSRILDDMLSSLVYNAIWGANVAHITASADNLRYGALEELPPDELRVPVTVNTVSSIMSIPYETTRRYANRLVRDGYAVRKGGRGLIIPREKLNQAPALEAIRLNYAVLLRLIGEVHRAGFDFSGY